MPSRLNQQETQAMRRITFPRTVFLVGVFILLCACTTPPVYQPVGKPLPPCGLLPNCVNSYSLKAREAVSPLRASAQQWSALNEWLATQPNWTLVDERANFRQWRVLTPTLRFRDDVQLYFVVGEGIIHIRSSSRLGVGDMGTNRNRVEGLRATLKKLLVPRP